MDKTYSTALGESDEREEPRLIRLQWIIRMQEENYDYRDHGNYRKFS
jgi:hypothetical protein